MMYGEIVVWLADDILQSTESPDDVKANVDTYMADLTTAVHKIAAAGAGEIAQPMKEPENQR